MNATETEWITRAEAARRAGVHLRTVAGWLAKGKLTRYVDGVGRVRIDADELRTLIEPRLP